MTNGIIQSQDQAEQRVEEWLHLDDFSPGVYDNSYISTAAPVVSAPLGAANADTTFCCASLPSGGLGPLPARTGAFGYPFVFPGSATAMWITGIAVNPGLDDGITEVLILLEADDGTDHYSFGFSYGPPGPSASLILSVTSATTPGIFGAPYPAWTRISTQPVIGSPGYILPTPTLVFPGAVVTDPNGTTGHIYLYPDPSSPTVYGTKDIVTVGSTGGAGQVICYGGRIVVLNGVDSSWPAGGGVNTNENVDFTDPPMGETYPNQQTILAAEQPWGYGAWGSISIGELLLVKKYGGGIILNGDIADPNSVIEAPGIEPIGDFVGRASASAIGLVYCSQDRGAWLWNGGNTSQKISQQIRDNFYDCFTSVIASNNYGFFCERWQDWILFSNNFLFNPDTGGWWTLYPRSSAGNANVIGRDIFHWGQGRQGNIMYGAPLRIDTVNTRFDLDWLVQFDSTVGAPSWQWESLPIHVVPTADRVIDVRQVVVRVSSPDGTSTPTLKVSIGSWTATTDDVIGVNPTTFRFNVGAGALGLEDIVLELVGNNASGSAPIVHSLDVGYNIRASIATDN